VLALTRQALPPLVRPAGADPKAVWRGGYLARDANETDVVLVATGSEVSLACEAAEKLASQQVAARVVSMRHSNSSPSSPTPIARTVAGRRDPIVAVEMARGESFCASRRARLVYGIQRFGASAPQSSSPAASGSRRINSLPGSSRTSTAELALR